ncbi:MAG TPA: rRNA adenine N(6)-methyltransferase family protein [Actinomycetota bacterium]|nr:rRNA adenine N(6)-methyltransferase family protein [Actinomycetota bacterium]
MRPHGDRKPHRGQHFLKTAAKAAELVEDAGISSSDLVVEIGAGKGRITEQLFLRARKVVAIEEDPNLATLLIRRFEGHPEVVVAAGDALTFPMPGEEFRVFGNIPFGITTGLLRLLLDDPASGLARADLIVQLGAALKRVRPPRSNLQNIRWGPWWEFQLGRRIPARAFDPAPSVEAALLSVERRIRPLLPLTHSGRFADFVSRAFGGDRPIVRALGPTYSAARVKLAASAAGFAAESRASDVILENWVRIFKELEMKSD